MNLWKIYRWSFLGGILGTISLILPVRSFIASTPYLDAQQSQPLLVWGSLVIYVGIMVLTGFLVAKNSPATNKKQAALWGITGTVFASLILYSGLLASFAGFYALYKVFPMGIYPNSLSDVQYTDMVVKIVGNIFAHSTLYFWASIFAGVILGGLGGFFTKRKEFPGETFFFNTDLIPVSLVGVIYGMLIAILGVSVSLMKNTLNELGTTTRIFDFAFTLQTIFPLLWLLTWQTMNWVALQKSINFINKRNISGIISKYVSAFATFWQILLLAVAFNGVYDYENRGKIEYSFLIYAQKEKQNEDYNE